MGNLCHQRFMMFLDFVERSQTRKPCKWSVSDHQLKTGPNFKGTEGLKGVFIFLFLSHFLFKAFIFEGSGQCDKRCVVTTTKQGLGNSRHTQRPSSGPPPSPLPINCGQSKRGKKVWNTSLRLFYTEIGGTKIWLWGGGGISSVKGKMTIVIF